MAETHPPPHRNLQSEFQLKIPTRHFGTVKKFNEEKGFGFFHVNGFSDVFFHISDLRHSAITSVKMGDKFFMEVQEKPTKDSRPVFRARKLEAFGGPQDTQSAPSHIRNQKGSSRHNYNNGSSGDFVSIPSQQGPIYQVTSQHGEIVTKDLNKLPPKNKPTKPVHLGQGRIKIGQPCVVPVMNQNPRIVSATGPGSAEMAPPKEDPEAVRLRENINKKKILMRSLKLEKLPDGGRRLKDEINSLELQLQSLSVKEKSGKSEKYRSIDHMDRGKENVSFPKHQIKTKEHVPKLSPYDVKPDVKLNTFAPTLSIKSLAQQDKTKPKQSYLKFEPLGTKMEQLTLNQYDMGPMKFSEEPLYGGRMTSTRLTEVRKITKEAIESLHKSLENCPGPGEELDDPKGLLVTLMTHQRQALAWMVWRESQHLSGGILADDMGLGKTLTMISLILKQIDDNTGEKKEAEEEDEIEEFDSSTESHDSDVILIEDEKSVKKEFKKERADKGSANEEEKPEEEKNNLVKSESTLIIAPASLLFHWEKEIKNRCKRGLLSIHLFHGTSREKDAVRLAEFDVVITTYDIVRRCTSARKKTVAASDDKNESTLMQIEWRRIILDEAHQIKNHKSQTSEAACQLTAKARWAMSGTPVQNNLTDMYSMLKFLHCRPFDEYKVWKHQVDNKTAKGQERLKTLVSCVVLRREKSQNGLNGKPLINLPKRSFVIHKLKLSPVEREVYTKLQTDSQAAFRKFQDKKKTNSGMSQTKDSGNMTATTLLVMLLRLRQCCGHLSLLKESFDPELLSNEKKELALEDMFQSMDISKSPAVMADISINKYETKDKAKYFEKSFSSGKVEFVLDNLNKLRFEKPNDKCVIISQWTGMLEVVAVHLNKAEISYDIIKGSVPAKKRMDIVEEFNRNPSRPMVMLLSLQAGGVGLNLIGGNHLFLLDMHWNPALESQAFDRIYRVGQTKDVFVHKFVVEDSVEERIFKLQEYKLSIAKAVMEGAGMEDRKKLTLQDMKLLFGI